MKPQEIETVEQLKQYIKENPPKGNKVTILKRTPDLEKLADGKEVAGLFFVDGIGIFKFEDK